MVTPLSRLIISGELTEDCKVTVDHRPGEPELSFAVTKDEVAAAARASANAGAGSGLKKMRLAPGVDGDDEFGDDMDE